MRLWEFLKEGWTRYSEYMSYEMMAYLPPSYWEELYAENDAEQQDWNY